MIFIILTRVDLYLIDLHTVPDYLSNLAIDLSCFRGHLGSLSQFLKRSNLLSRNGSTSAYVVGAELRCVLEELAFPASSWSLREDACVAPHTGIIWGGHSVELVYVESCLILLNLPVVARHGTSVSGPAC